MGDSKITIANDAIDEAVKLLAHLPQDEDVKKLLAHAEDLRNEVGTWRDRPPSDVEREDVMRRILALNSLAAQLLRP